jgi:hypothetical protein
VPPVEPVWSYLKRFLANRAKRNLSQLAALVKTRLAGDRNAFVRQRPVRLFAASFPVRGR